MSEIRLDISRILVKEGDVVIWEERDISMAIRYCIASNFRLMEGIEVDLTRKMILYCDLEQIAPTASRDLGHIEEHWKLEGKIYKVAVRELRYPTEEEETFFRSKMIGIL